MLSTNPPIIETVAGSRSLDEDRSMLAKIAQARCGPPGLTPKDSEATPSHAAETRPGGSLEDEESTDAPSSALCSDADSLSGAEGAGSDSCADDEKQGPMLQNFLLSRTTASHKCRQSQLGRIRLSAAARLKHRNRGAPFTGTPLDSIPGTPHGMTEHPPLLFPVSRCPDVEESQTSVVEESPPDAIQLMMPLAPQTLLSTSPPLGSRAASPVSWLPKSPKKRVCAVFMEKAKQDGLPIKISMLHGSADIQKRTPPLDPTMPVKKRPIMSGSVAQELLDRLKPGVPVKKRVTPWILAEPMRVFPAAPR